MVEAKKLMETSDARPKETTIENDVTDQQKKRKRYLDVF